MIKIPRCFPPALWKSYRHKCEHLLSLCSHSDQKQKHWEGKDTVWIHRRAWRSMWETEKSPGLLSHHTAKTVDASRHSGDLAAMQDEREAALCGSLEGEGKGTIRDQRTRHGEKWQHDRDARHCDLPDVWKSNLLKRKLFSLLGDSLKSMVKQIWTKRKADARREIHLIHTSHCSREHRSQF